jgi:DNA-binding ferritin-like protein
MNISYLQKTRNYHWNVVGLNFSERHKFFQERYEQIDEIIDEVAERARTLNGRSLGTLQIRRTWFNSRKSRKISR